MMNSSEVKDAMIPDCVVKEENISLNKWRTRCGIFFRRNLLVFLTLIGVGVGFIIGFVIAPSRPTASTLLWIGKSMLFLRATR